MSLLEDIDAAWKRWLEERTPAEREALRLRGIGAEAVPEYPTQCGCPAPDGPVVNGVHVACGRRAGLPIGDPRRTALTLAREEAHREGVTAERARIVAALRNDYDSVPATAAEFADEIEAGRL